MTLPRQRPRHVDADPAPEQLSEQLSDQAPDRPSDQAPDRLSDQAPDRLSDHAPDRAREQDSLSLFVERLAGPDHRVREAALRELVGLADVQPRTRATAVAAVCAYLRSPWTAERQGGAVPSGEPELRRTALGMLAERLRDPEGSASWCGYDLDLAGAVLAGADFAGCWFTGGRVRLEGGWAIEGQVSFDGARFDGARVSLRHWSSGQGELSFRGARFSAGVVSLAGAVVNAGVLSAVGAVVDGGTLALTEVTVDGGVLDLSRIVVSAGLLTLSDARLNAGQVLLRDARMTGGRTALRNVRSAPRVLETHGALVRPGTVDVEGSFEADLNLPPPSPRDHAIPR